MKNEKKIVIERVPLLVQWFRFSCTHTANFMQWVVAFILLIWVLPQFDFITPLAGGAGAVSGFVFHVYSYGLAKIDVPQLMSCEDLVQTIEDVGYVRSGEGVFDTKKAFGNSLIPRRIYVKSTSCGYKVIGPYENIKKISQALYLREVE